MPKFIYFIVLTIFSSACTKSDDRFLLGTSINIPEQKISFTCERQVELTEIPDWIEPCEKAIKPAVKKLMRQQKIKLEEVPEYVFRFKSTEEFKSEFKKHLDRGANIETIHSKEFDYYL